MRPDQWAAAVAVRWISRAIYGFFGGFRVEGLEHIWGPGPMILAVNHVSLADPLMVVAATPRVMRYLTARDIMELPYLGTSLLYLGSHPVTRGAADPEAMAVARTWLRRGDTVVIFPEGKCSQDGTLQPILPGVAVLALRERVPVVPVVLHGTDRMLPLGARFPVCYPKVVRYGPRLHLGGVVPKVPIKQQLEEACGKLRRAMLALGAAPAPEDSLPG